MQTTPPIQIQSNLGSLSQEQKSSPNSTIGWDILGSRIRSMSTETKGDKNWQTCASDLDKWELACVPDIERWRLVGKPLLVSNLGKPCVFKFTTLPTDELVHYNYSFSIRHKLSCLELANLMRIETDMMMECKGPSREIRSIAYNMGGVFYVTLYFRLAEERKQEPCYRGEFLGDYSYSVSISFDSIEFNECPDGIVRGAAKYHTSKLEKFRNIGVK